MFNKIVGAGGTKPADKTKKTGASTAAGGPSFAKMLEAAGQADAQGLQDAVQAPYVPAYMPLTDDEPLDPRQAGKKLLGKLEDLAADMMTATPGQHAAELQKLMDNLPPTESMNAGQKQVWDELTTRVATTLEKLKQK